MSDLTTAPLMWVAKETGLWSMVSTTMVENPIACFDSLTLRTSVSQRLTAWRPVRSLGQMSRLVVRISGLIERPQSFDVRTTNSSSSRRAPPGSSTSVSEIDTGKDGCSRAKAVRRRASRSAASTILAGHLLHLACAQRGCRHGLEVALDRRLDRGDHRTFYERRVAEQHATVAVGELLDRHLGTEPGAAEVGEHVITAGGLDGFEEAAPDLHGEVVLLDLDAERSRDAAASLVDLLELDAGDQPQQSHRRVANPMGLQVAGCVIKQAHRNGLKVRVQLARLVEHPEVLHDVVGFRPEALRSGDVEQMAVIV